MFTDTFAGIAPPSVPLFVLAQLIGGAIALAAIRMLYPATRLAAELTDLDDPLSRNPSPPES